jgi:hypothetical protein
MWFFVVALADQAMSMGNGVDPPDSGWSVGSQFQRESLMFKGSIAAETPSCVLLASNIACDITFLGEVNITSSGEVYVG